MKAGRTALLVGLLSAATAVPMSGALPLRLVGSIPLPGVEGRIDHLAVDVARRRLFVAALANDTLEVLDLTSGKRIRTVHGMQEPQGVLFLAGRNRLVVSDGRTGECEILDGGSFERTGRVSFGGDADNLRVDAAGMSVYVGYGEGALGIFAAASGERMGDIALAGHPESFQLEASGSKIYVNVPSKGHVAVVDRKAKKVIATWTLKDAASNYPMALDEAGHRLFVGCRTPPSLVAYDTGSGREIARSPIHGDVDDLFFDAARMRIYASCGEGFVDILQQTSLDLYESVAHFPTAVGARTSLFVPELGRLYLAAPRRGSRAAEIRVYEVVP